MLGFQTIARLGDIPVVRSSTSKLQEVYGNAKNKYVFIQTPCNLVEIIAGRSLKIASSVANPFVKPLNVSVRAFDGCTIEKLRQIGSKYPVMNALNRKTEPIRHVINSVKDKTKSTIQYSRETVSNIANAVVKKATTATNTVYTFCETYVPGNTIDVCHKGFGRLTSSIRSTANEIIQLLVPFLLYFQMFIVSFLLKTKQKVSTVMSEIDQKSYFSTLLKRYLIYTDIALEYAIEHIQSDETREHEERSEQMQHQKQQTSRRQTLKPGALFSPHQSGRIRKQNSTTSRSKSAKPQVNADEKFNQILNFNRIDESKPPIIEDTPSDDNDNFQDELKLINAENLYSKLTGDNALSVDDEESSPENEQIIHAKLN